MAVKFSQGFWMIAFFVLVLIVFSALGGALADRLFVFRPLDSLIERSRLPSGTMGEEMCSAREVVNEESVVISVAEQSAESVVTIAIERAERARDLFFLDQFGFFGSERLNQPEVIQRDIGTGFVIDQSGLIVTNKHVVSDARSTYKVITKDNTELSVERIYRDPANDLAILKVNTQLQPLPLGSSDGLKVGQYVIAIGTALGEFRHTVTTGVISGLGRGIEASDGFRGFVERLDNVIQTDAAINPGNSGGPLLNSSGEVIGVSVAIAASGQNIGFAIPINVVKESLDQFNQTGQFDRPFLGVQYRMLTREAALLNDVPQGAYLVKIVPGSAADQAGLLPGDIITVFAGEQVRNVEHGLAEMINRQRVGTKVQVTLWRDGQEIEVSITLRANQE